MLEAAMTPTLELNMLIMLTIFSTGFSPASSAASQDICSNITNPECSCIASTSSETSILCTFVTQPPKPLFSLPASPVQLEVLDLSNNRLNDLPDDFFHGNVSVKKLVLRNNSFTKIPAVLTKLARLRNLDMAENELRCMSMEVLTATAGLQKLDLSNNKLRNLSAVDRNVKLQNINELNLSMNAITSIDSKIFSSLSHLTILDLSHNLLSELTENLFSQMMAEMVSLDISHNHLRNIESQALKHLQHLRVLNLAHNVLLTNVNDVEFPRHLRSLDLSHCTLNIINHCQLTSLADLSFIGLTGNELQCTCQLYLLLQWYQNQHHMTGDLDANSTGSNWTCVNSTVLITSIAPPSRHHAGVVTDPPLPGISKVLEMKSCQDSGSHCQTLEHSEHHIKGSSEMEVALFVASTGNTIMASWTFKENSEFAIEGFQLRYIPEDASPQTSPVIAADQRSYVMKSSELEKHYVVCLDVLAFETAVVRQVCHSYKDESSNIVVGILAGIIFLVPCLVIMAYVIFKDRFISKASNYQHVKVSETDVESDKSIFEKECDSQLKDNGGLMSAHDNDTPHQPPDTHTAEVTLTQIVVSGENDTKKENDNEDQDNLIKSAESSKTLLKPQGVTNPGFNCTDGDKCLQESADNNEKHESTDF